MLSIMLLCFLSRTPLAMCPYSLILGPEVEVFWTVCLIVLGDPGRSSQPVNRTPTVSYREKFFRSDKIGPYATN